MSVYLLPRLTTYGSLSILEAATNEAITEARARQMVGERASMVSYAASGGRRADDVASAITARIREVAVTSGFPNNPSQVSRSKFDRDAAIALATMPELQSGEALRDDVWAYMTMVRLPDIVAWRFPDRGDHRFSGGVRNTLQRLWVRATTLDRGEGHEDRWGLVRALTEDAAVQIFERPSIGGSPPIALAVAEAWVALASKIGRMAMEPVMRQAVKLTRLRNEIIDISGLPTEERQVIIQACFETASTAAKLD